MKNSERFNGIRNLAASFRTHSSPFKLNESGMTLVEIMVVSGIMMVLGLGFATMMTNVGRQQKKIERDSDIVQMQNHVRTTAGSPQALGSSLTVTD